MSAPVLMWFRRDLRLADNEALATAIGQGGPVVPVCVDAGRNEDPYASGRASRAWLAHSVRALDEELRSRGSRLTIARGPAPAALVRLARETDARVVYCTREWTPLALAEETAVAGSLAALGVELEVREGLLLAPPHTLATANGTPYRVFTPFYRAWARAIRAMPVGGGGPVPPLRLTAPDAWPASAPLPAPPSGAPGVAAWWRPGEAGARARLDTFMRDHASSYAETHDRADLDATSRLSPHFAFGELSARRAAVSVIAAAGVDAATPFLRQLAWREFAYHVLNHFPALPAEPLQPHFSAMPWADDPSGRDAWRAGQTGIPLVDAGMRELAVTGWMHNRARLVAGSLLAKSLLVRWQEGEAWFADALVDADLALNAFNWQWVAGSGADAAPYFRIFNPARQGAKVDPDGAYVRRWVPELAEMPSRWVHAPHEAPAAVLSASGVVLGTTYPRPVIDHAESRLRALAAYEAVKAARR